MLGIRRVRGERADYYLTDLGRELPVAEPARWTGESAARLGLVGPLEAEGFRRVLAGRHPFSGHAMGSGRVAVAAYDLTFSAPKSVSALFALGGREAARCAVAAHLDAVAGAITYLERRAVTARRSAGADRVVVPTTGMIAGQFTHAVSRSGDPHVHTHVVMANLVHGVDGRWSACDQRGIAAHRSAASAVYGAHLRAGLAVRLGVRWEAAPGRTAEVAGVRPELLGELSSRSADIRRRVHEVGARSRRGAHVAWAATRPDKGPALAYAELAREWADRARSAGAPLRLPSVTREAGNEERPPRLLDEHRFAAELSLTPHGGARRRDVVVAFGEAATGGIPADHLEDMVAAWVAPCPPGVAEPVRPRRDVVPSNHLLRALGARPLRPRDHEIWVGAAALVEAYRGRWGITRSPEPLGVVEARALMGLASLPAGRLADHIRTARQLREAQRRLGRREAVEIELGLGR